MLEEVGGKNGGGSSGQLLGREQQKGLHSEAEAPRWNGGACEEATNIGYESGEKTARQESSLCSENLTCSICKAWMKIPRKKQK